MPLNSPCPLIPPLPLNNPQPKFTSTSLPPPSNTITAYTSYSLSQLCLLVRSGRGGGVRG
ncbi:hypothetical protein JAAARDRAFT_30739, partial [Jaapia argillacea MUCL 33604]